MKNTTRHSAARRYNDVMSCSACGRMWDVDDEDPPPCEGSVTKPVPVEVLKKKPSARIAHVSGSDLSALRKAIETGDWSKYE